ETRLEFRRVLFRSLEVADDHPVGQGVDVVGLAQHGSELHRLLVDLAEIALVGEGVLTDLKGDVGVVGAAPGGAGAGVPAPVVPGQGLDSAHGAVGQLANKCVGTHIQAGVVPVVGVAIATDGGLQGGTVGVVVGRLHIAGHQRVVG